MVSEKTGSSGVDDTSAKRHSEHHCYVCADGSHCCGENCCGGRMGPTKHNGVPGITRIWTEAGKMTFPCECKCEGCTTVEYSVYTTIARIVLSSDSGMNSGRVIYEPQFRLVRPGGERPSDDR